MAIRFRTAFNYSGIPILFKHQSAAPYILPQHIRKGVKRILSLIHKADLFIEVIDARTPISGQCALSSTYLPLNKPHLFLFNKIDLSEKLQETENYLLEQGISKERFVLGRTKLYKRSKKVSMSTTNTMNDLIGRIKSHMTEFDSEVEDFTILIIGNPNTGKSSLINAMRYVEKFRTGEVDRVSKLAVRVGKRPGLTQRVTTPILISRDPRIVVLDTPGVLPPTPPNPEATLKMAAVHSLWENFIDPVKVADFILFSLNKQHKFKYASFYGLPSPTDSLTDLLRHIAEKKELRTIKGEWDTYNASQIFAKEFRDGSLGVINLDANLLGIEEVKVENENTKAN